MAWRGRTERVTSSARCRTPDSVAWPAAPSRAEPSRPARSATILDAFRHVVQLSIAASLPADCQLTRLQTEPRIACIHSGDSEEEKILGAMNDAPHSAHCAVHTSWFCDTLTFLHNAPTDFRYSVVSERTRFCFSWQQVGRLMMTAMKL